MELDDVTAMKHSLTASSFTEWARTLGRCCGHSSNMKQYRRVWVWVLEEKMLGRRDGGWREGRRWQVLVRNDQLRWEEQWWSRLTKEKNLDNQSWMDEVEWWMDDREDGGTERWTMDGERAIWEGRSRVTRKTKLCVARWSSFNQNYKSLAVEKKNRWSYSMWRNGWKDGGVLQMTWSLYNNGNYAGLP